MTERTDSSDSLPLSPLPNPLKLLIAWQPEPDGESNAESLAMAAWLAKSLPVVVRAVTLIVRLWPVTSLGKLGNRNEDLLAHSRRSFRTKIEEAFTAAHIPESAWDPMPSSVLMGSSESALLAEAAADFGADLVLIGPDAAAPKGRFRAGSMADSLLHSSPVPLLLSPRQVKLAKHGISRINVAYLDSEQSSGKTSLEFAGEFAEALGVPVRLIAFSPIGMHSDHFDSHQDFTRALSAVWHEHALDMLDRCRDELMESRPQLKVNTDLGSGNGWGATVGSIKWKKGDVLCLGSPAQDALERVFVGSTAAKFLPHVPVPVIIHPARGGEAGLPAR